VNECNPLHLGYHVTEEGAAWAYDNCSTDGVVPVPVPQLSSSQFKGVSWHKQTGKWTAQCDGNCLGYHAAEEAAAQAYNDYVKDGVVPVNLRRTITSQFKGVSWAKLGGKWVARCKSTTLGYRATEEAAAQAYKDYVKNGVNPVPRREGTSQCMGVSWGKSNGKWKAQCKRTYLGCHATEEAAARAYNIEAERFGLPLNVIPPAGDTDDGSNIAAAALVLPSPAALVRAHGGAGSKRGAPRTPAALPTKAMRLDTSAGVAGATAAATVAAHAQGSARAAAQGGAPW
jgi:hypothetical protein